MIMYEIKDYIKKRQVVSTKELARVFDMSESAIEGIASWWVAKGVIAPYQRAICQGSCAKSQCSLKLHYQFVNA
jgi:hypothetical protein